VAKLAELFSHASTAILTDYRGLSVKQLTQLRSRLRPLGVEYRITKNTLTRRALEQAGKPALGELLQGPIAIAFSTAEPNEVAKVLGAFARESRLLALKGGLVGDRVLDQAQVEELATLPGREAMLGMLLGSLQAPLVGLVRTLQGMITGLVFTLQAVADRKGAAA